MTQCMASIENKSSLSHYHKNIAPLSTKHKSFPALPDCNQGKFQLTNKAQATTLQFKDKPHLTKQNPSSTSHLTLTTKHTHHTSNQEQTSPYKSSTTHFINQTQAPSFEPAQVLSNNLKPPPYQPNTSPTLPAKLTPDKHNL